MKFNLVKDEIITFAPEYHVDSEGIKYRSVSVNVNISPAEETRCGDYFATFMDFMERSRVNGIENHETCSSNGIGRKTTSSLPWSILVSLGLHVDGHEANLEKSYVHLYGNISDNCFTRIHEFANLHSFDARVVVKFKNFGLSYKDNETRTGTVSTHETELSMTNPDTVSLQCTGLSVEDWEYRADWLSQEFSIDGLLDVEVILNNKTDGEICMSLSSFGTDVNRKILCDEIASDLLIIPADGKPIKCHKTFLLAHSSVFEAMFKDVYQEARTNSIEMSDITEKGVRALLEFLYLGDTVKAHENFEIALELLQASHKYAIQSLEDIMKNMFLSQPDSWYVSELAIKLFIFVRNVDSWNDIKSRAVSILKINHEKLKMLKEYQQLFKEPDIAMELFKCAK